MGGGGSVPYQHKVPHSTQNSRAHPHSHAQSRHTHTWSISSFKHTQTHTKMESQPLSAKIGLFFFCLPNGLPYRLLATCLRFLSKIRTSQTQTPNLIREKSIRSFDSVSEKLVDPQVIWENSFRNTQWAPTMCQGLDLALELQRQWGKYGFWFNVAQRLIFSLNEVPVTLRCLAA